MMSFWRLVQLKEDMVDLGEAVHGNVVTNMNTILPSFSESLT